MDRRERQDDPVEAQRAAMDGQQAQMWTALPGIVQAFDAAAMTVSVQPAVAGQILNETGQARDVNLPLLVDVPVVFPAGGGFTLTFPVAAGDECLVVFASRCIDGWWQSGGIGAQLDKRMHDLSDGFALVGPRSQARKLDPAVDTANVQLRSDDGQAHVTIMPDLTVRMMNPTCRVELTPDGEVAAEAETRILLKAPNVKFETDSLDMSALNGGGARFNLTGDIVQEGSHTSTGDQVAGGISQIEHVHGGVQTGSGNTGAPA